MSKEDVQVEAGVTRGHLEPVRPAASAALLRLSREQEANVDVLAAATVERLRETMPAWMLDTVFPGGEIARVVRSSLRLELHGFRRGTLPTRAPEIDALGAQAMAKIGELKLLLAAYRIAQGVLWTAWFERVERSAESPAVSDELLRYGSQYFTLYADLLTDLLTDVYQRELEQSVRSGEQRRLHAIRCLLEGKPLVGSQLDLDLDQYHLGLIAWGDEAEAAARELAAALNRRLLIIGPFVERWWGWISGARPLTRTQERQLVELRLEAEGQVALGLEGFGEAGFRTTNRQALRARAVCGGLDAAIVSYADVAVEALVNENPCDARAFVAHELRGIDDDSPASRKIRETLAAYFAAEHNAASAAAALGVHQQTVANRLRAAEERLGRPIGTRHLELETALRLWACLERQRR